MSQTPPASPEAVYRQRCADFGAERDRLSRRSSRNANVSLALVALALAALGVALWLDDARLLGLAGLLGLAFIVSFVHHGRVDQAVRRYAELHAINDEGLARLRRDWAALPLRQPPDLAQAQRALRPAVGSGRMFAPLVSGKPQTAAEESPANAATSLSADIDLLGHASLQHLLNTPATPVGQATLRGWLMAPAEPAQARARQSGVAELAPQHEFRDGLALRGRLLGGAQATYERFCAWAEHGPWLAGRGWLLWAARVLPIATLLLAALQWLGLIGAPLWLAGAAAGVVLTVTAGRAVDRVIDEVAERQQALATYAAIFELIGRQPWASPELRRAQAELAAHGLRAELQMRRLARLMALADLRGWMFFVLIQVTTLWNVHVLWLLERWQREAGAHARGWLAALGEIEALAALATLAHDHPSWAFPELADAPTGPTLQARALGHPLLPPASRVDNDVAIGPAGRLLLITGSNMSGKSTLLRAIGLNVALAQAGAPVCAAELRLAPVALATSMRVQDSLEQGVSYFLAELQRLKAVVALAERERAAGRRTALFLLDEILHGTNSSERLIAARQILLRLLELGATGAVSTHDLALADTPELAAASESAHFTEQFARGPDGLSMTFDYRLRPGIATSTNALKLVEMLGLGRASRSDSSPA